MRAYRLQKNVRVFVEVLNALNKKVNDVDYDYASLLKGGASPLDMSASNTAHPRRLIPPHSACISPEPAGR